MKDSNETPKKGKDDLLKLLQEVEITSETFHHPPVFTVEEARLHTGHLPGGHCKNLFLKDRSGAFWLVVAVSDTQVNLKSLRRSLRTSALRFGDEASLWKKLGVEKGSVTPFGLINDNETTVTVVLDPRLRSFEQLNFHPLQNDATTTLSTRDFMRLLEMWGGCTVCPERLC